MVVTPPTRAPNPHRPTALTPSARPIGPNLGRGDRLLISVLGMIGKLLLGTLRLRMVDAEHYTRFRDESQPVIFVVWHSRLLLAMLPARVFGTVSLASPTRDGQIGAQVARHLGIESVSGDARYRGTVALRQLARVLATGRDVGLFPDGPLGPARRMKTGPLILARQSGCPIIPVGLGAAWKLRLRSHWDEFAFPLPFSRVIAIAAEAVRVPRDSSAGDVEALALNLEERLNQLNSRADRLCGSQPRGGLVGKLHF